MQQAKQQKDKEKTHALFDFEYIENILIHSPTCAHTYTHRQTHTRAHTQAWAHTGTYRNREGEGERVDRRFCN